VPCRVAHALLRRLDAHNGGGVRRLPVPRSPCLNTLRQRMSRLVRETLSFSKKLANHMGAIKLFICHYNLTKVPALHG
jgi:hypothetical protein